MVDIFSDPIIPDVGSSPLEETVEQITLQVEVALKENAKCRFDAAAQYVEQYIRDNYSSLSKDTEMKQFDDYDQVLKNNVARVYVVEILGTTSEIARVNGSILNVHVYQLHENYLQICEIDEEGSTSQESFASSLDLPATSLGTA